MRGSKSRRDALTPLGDAVRRELGRHGPQAGMADLVERWPEAVGPAVARFAWPARIGRDGTVHVNAADSVWAFELGHRAAEIARRLDVASVRFVPGPLPAADPVAQPRDVPAPRPEDRERAAALAAPITDENLRETVQKAIALALAHGSSDRSV
jgi:hypothetical protein